MSTYMARVKRMNFPGILAVLLLVILFANSEAADTTISESLVAKKLDLFVGKSIIVKTFERVKRVSIAAPEVADFVLLSPHEIYLTGKAAGTTNLTLWQDKEVSSIYDLEVAFDVTGFKRKLNELLPGEKDIRAVGTHESITLSGTVSSTDNLSQVLALAEAYAPKEKIVNLLQVAGIHQVMLEVRVAEMARTLAKRLGVNFSYLRGGDFFVSRIGGLTGFAGTEGGIVQEFADAVTALFRFSSGDAQWTFFIDALQETGLTKILAEPTLIAMSGQTATFLAGGEFPIPVPQGLGTVAVEYKNFGVALSFTPTVLSEDRISIEVAPEVSELDFSTSIFVSGFAVPGLTTRRASTLVKLADGQSFAIAGLLRETVRQEIVKFPLLGDIPILGALFRSNSFLKGETELVIVVTPHLVKPLDLAKQTLPTDYYIEPNDVEFYILGLMEGRERTKSANVTGELDGEFGHAMRISE